MSVRGQGGGEGRPSLPPASRQHVEGCTQPWRGAMCPGSGHLLARHPTKNEGSCRRRPCGLPPTRHRAGPRLPRTARGGGALHCPLGAMPATYRGPSHWHRAAQGRAQTRLDSGQAPSGSPCWLEATHWASLGLGPGSHLVTVMTQRTALPPTLPRHP